MAAAAAAAAAAVRVLGSTAFAALPAKILLVDLEGHRGPNLPLEHFVLAEAVMATTVKATIVVVECEHSVPFLIVIDAPSAGKTMLLYQIFDSSIESQRHGLSSI